ncbi:Sigma-54-dependent Fis family transcriptional regulator [Candidatus Trichorickettsia mobilis]|uniref:Putative response regulator NtrX-like n=2 Tax=Candidatus Trichorickettsia mobilis TaxID=1346319 RepID=A0ABZ0UU32_9RICK|nr:Sigma-54-dependent Fis family transcriptional regulator [Candidatus Trichorickettsia mobilis]
MSLDVLIIDDEADIRDLISDILKDEGFNSRVAANSTQTFKLISEKVPSAIILDIWLQGSDLDGLGILEIIKKRYPLMPVVVISGHGTIETAVSAIKMGAYDYLEKPFTHDRLMIVLKRACEAAKLKRENLDLKSKVVDKTELVGASSSTIKLKSDIEKVAPTSGRVMIHGEMGSGKELAARLIHKKSKKAHGPFIVFSPTCMSTDKMQQELFGEPERQDANSVFTKRLSVLEAANNGTIYIDEVGDLAMPIQIKLLKFLQDQILEKPATGKSLKVDIRFITATTKNLQNEINQGRFRQDLYYRLNVVPIKVPSLSERKDDIPLLVKYFIKQLAKFSGLKEREFSEDTMAALQAYNWSGNVRQLRNVIEWTLIMNPVSVGGYEIIKPDMLPSDILNHGVTITKPDNNLDMMSMPLREAREVFERQYLSAQMSRFNNNISKTSSFVGMERSALHRKLKLLSIHTASAKMRDEEYQEEQL